MGDLSETFFSFAKLSLRKGTLCFPDNDDDKSHLPFQRLSGSPTRCYDSAAKKILESLLKKKVERDTAYRKIICAR